MKNLFVVVSDGHEIRTVEYVFTGHSAGGGSVYDVRHVRDIGRVLTGQRRLDRYGTIVPMNNTLVGKAQFGRWEQIGVGYCEYWTASRKVAERVAGEALLSRAIRLTSRCCCCAHIIRF